MPLPLRTVSLSITSMNQRTKKLHKLTLKKENSKQRMINQTFEFKMMVWLLVEFHEVRVFKLAISTQIIHNLDLLQVHVNMILHSVTLWLHDSH